LRVPTNHPLSLVASSNRTTQSFRRIYLLPGFLVSCSIFDFTSVAVKSVGATDRQLCPAVLSRCSPVLAHENCVHCLANLAPPTRDTFSLLRYLFPHTHQRAKDRLSGFRHEVLPHYRYRARELIALPPSSRARHRFTYATF